MVNKEAQKEQEFAQTSLGILWLLGVVLLVILGLSAPVLAQEEDEAGSQTTANADVEITPLAPVEVDGNTLFHVRGVAAFPPVERAEAIAQRIKEFAADKSKTAADLRTIETEFGTEIFAGNQRLMVVTDGDAKVASLPRKMLAEVIVTKVGEALTNYRQSRSRPVVIRSIARAAVATAIFAALVALIVWLKSQLHLLLEKRYHKRIHMVGIQSFQVVRAEQIWNALQRVIQVTRWIAILAIVFTYLQYVLALFPWTRGTASRLRGYVVAPLITIGTGILSHIPAVIFLLVLYFIARWSIKLIHRFFNALKAGEVKLGGFDPDWAESTYKLIRLGIVILAVVVAYPYIPGARSEAFKGISIFIGLVISLGSSSAIANLIAGYTMTYRRAFRLGDRVKIGEVTGDVTEMRLQVTHLKTVKNEEVIIPNSAILNNEVVNYSSLAHKTGLILHTTVSIGYQTPWRQVEAMLLLAAERTPGTLKEPPPFVLQKGLGDFSVTYEINVYCDNPQGMAATYSMLHRNILDLFNEYGVQIMTPAYEGDPEVPKVVPKEQWFSAPAQPALEAGNGHARTAT